LECPDVNFDDDAIPLPVMEISDDAPVHVVIVAHDPSVVVSEAPVVFSESVPQIVLQNDEDLHDVLPSLGSMGIRERPEEIIDDNQVIISSCIIQHFLQFVCIVWCVLLTGP